MGSIFRKWSVAAGVAMLATTLAVAQFTSTQTTGTQSAGTTQAQVINSPDLIFPRVRVINLDNTVTRFDTATGELLRFNGDLSGPSAKGLWLRLVRPVTQPTSGFLDVRQVGGGTFLIDLDTGQSWILRRNTALGSWIVVQTQ